jgi:glycosyltransferase involved in cell wall biosynthesis
MKQTKKRRIALFALGVIGGGPVGNGIPVLRDLFVHLSREYDIIYYSFYPVFKREVPPELTLRVAPTWQWLPVRLRYLLLVVRFVWDHHINKIDFIFSVSDYPSGLWAIRLGKLFRLKIAVQLIGYEAVNIPALHYGNLANPGMAIVTKNVCESAPILIAQSHYQRRIALESLQMNRDIVVLPLSIDSSRFKFRSRIVSSTVRIIHISYRSPIKDQNTLFRSFANIRKSVDAQLTVIGDGFDSPDVYTMLRDLKIEEHVSFKGNIANKHIPAFLDQADILMHTSLYEACCMVVLEAMASGVAVSATSVGILADIGDHYAMLAQPGDMDQITKNTLSLINNADLYREITTRAYHWIVQNDLAKVSEQHRQFIENTLKN